MLFISFRNIVLLAADLAPKTTTNADILFFLDEIKPANEYYWSFE